MIYEFHTDPFKHQVYALKRALRKDKTAFLMDPGTGKTKAVIDYVACRYLRDGHKKIIVMCPKSVIGVWQEEIEKHLPPQIQRKVIRFNGSKGELPKHCPILTIILISFDSAWRIKAKLFKWKADGAIADESHYIANATSARSRGAHKIRTSCKWGVIMTGTFLPKNPLNAYSQLKFKDPDIFPMSWTKFKHKYAVWHRLDGWDKLIRYKRLKELNKIINEHSVVIKKEEALDLPKRIDQIIPVDMPPKAWRVYKELKKEKLVEFKKGKYASTDIILTELIRFQQITSGFVTVVDEDDEDLKEEKALHDEKIKTTIELIQTHKIYGEKVLVFCRYRWEINRLSEALRKARIKHGVLDGRTKDRDKLRKEFQRQDGQLEVLVVQISTGGVGITLTSANIVIFYTLTFQFDHYQQAKDRVHRPGQNKRVIYYHLIVRNSIDEHMMKALKLKKSLADRVTAKNWEAYV